MWREPCPKVAPRPVGVVRVGKGQFRIIGEVGEIIGLAIIELTSDQRLGGFCSCSSLPVSLRECSPRLSASRLNESYDDPEGCRA
jgi:hypothetical protein